MNCWCFKCWVASGYYSNDIQICGEIVRRLLPLLCQDKICPIAPAPYQPYYIWYINMICKGLIYSTEVNELLLAYCCKKKCLPGEDSFSETSTISMAVLLYLYIPFLLQRKRWRTELLSVIKSHSLTSITFKLSICVPDLLFLFKSAINSSASQMLIV